MVASVEAQVTADDSLGTTVNTSNGISEITAGTRLEGNLFHSFEDFSVATGTEAWFNNASDINNIISRVTGGNFSDIDGLIRANGDANLILINPNGITLGNNARLDIGGSFLGSTADNVVFDDGTVFNTELGTQPLLTISAPIGLQLGQNTAAIEVLGTVEALEVNPGNTLALVGNGITFDGGAIAVESGRLELGSVVAGEVSITEITAGWQLGYEGVTQLGQLQLLNESALLNPNPRDNSSGGIQLQGSEITLERSQITAQTIDDAVGGDITINAAESLTLSGVATMGTNASQISNNVVAEASGVGGSIDITTGRLEINPRSFIDNSIFGTGTAGNIDIIANQIEITGAGFLEFQQQYRIDALEGNLQPGSRITGIFAGTATTGTAGNIKIETNSLDLSDGAIIFTPVYTAGHGGNIEIAADSITLDASAIQNGGGRESTASASLGNINLNSDRLLVTNGATVINATFGDVAGGNITVTAGSIELRAAPPTSILGSGLFTNTTLGSGAGGNLNITATDIRIDDAIIASNSGAILPDGTFIPFGGLGGDINIQASGTIEATGIVFRADNPELVVGSGIGTSTYSSADGGNLTIETNQLIVREGANFTSATFGAGDGGQLTIDAAESVDIVGFITERGMNRGGLFASSNGDLTGLEAGLAGASGNIEINTPSLTVRDGAIIDVRSAGRADAGNIELSADAIVLSDRGALSATTEDGVGGSVEITTSTIRLERGLINASVLGSGTGGDIRIEAVESAVISGMGFSVLQDNLFDPDLLSPEFLASLEIAQFDRGILAVSGGSGNAGTIDIQARDIAFTEGGLVAAATGGSGAAGTIFLNARESLTIDSSFLSNNTLFTGQGGDISIDASRVEVLRGGQVTASTLGSGNGGSVTINASESVVVAGNVGESSIPSNISVGAQPLASATGNGGDLTINTVDLDIDGGSISIGSSGSGNAGRLLVRAESIVLDSQGVISADTQSGSGGNLILEADSIIWRGSSFTTATASDRGNGGNITILANNLVALEDSRIIANSFEGMGGNIQIDTKGLFLCRTCQITASSALGVDGVVEIETLEPTNAIDVLSTRTRLTQPQEEVAIACPNEPGINTSQLTITGRGGLPRRPQELLNARSLIEFKPQAKVSTPKPEATLPPAARGWYRTPDGTVILTAQTAHTTVNNSPFEGADCHH
ncbi:MAG: filamentous hemagglutinin N-terminal domain-containing protein [Cyanobacteria bacterium J06623_7]